MSVTSSENYDSLFSASSHQLCRIMEYLEEEEEKEEGEEGGKKEQKTKRWRRREELKRRMEKHGSRTKGKKEGG